MAQVKKMIEQLVVKLNEQGKEEATKDVMASRGPVVVAPVARTAAGGSTMEWSTATISQPGARKEIRRFPC